jgi:hypothetical protein
MVKWLSVLAFLSMVAGLLRTTKRMVPGVF